MHALARGEDERPVVPEREAKSLGAEETFERDRRSAAELEPFLLGQAQRVAARLTRAGLRGRCVTVKVKYVGHRLKTRQTRLPEPVSDTDSIYEAARGLLARFPELGRGVRLTGVSVSELSEGPVAPTLFPDERRERREKVEAVTQALGERFGKGTVKRGRLLGRRGRGDDEAS